MQGLIHKKINDTFYGGEKGDRQSKLFQDFQEARRIKNEVFDNLKVAKEETDRLKEAYSELVLPS